MYPELPTDAADRVAAALQAALDGEPVPARDSASVARAGT
jgi:hypothetical protein